MYKAHHIIGGLAFVMVLHHPLFLAVGALPNANLATSYVFFSRNLSYNLGVFSVYSFLLLLLLTFLIQLPYSLWKKTHNLMGIPLVFACLHIVTITSDVSRYFPLRVWMLFMIFFAILTAFYKILLYEKLGPRCEYEITKIEKSENVYIFSLLERGGKMSYKPGQFVFLKINCLGNEYHPYSIVSAPNELYLKVAIKVLGDYTLRLDRVCEKEGCVIQGPYGNFYKPMESDSDIVMIAGGIGITPFIGMIKESLSQNKSRKIDLFYAVRNKEDAVFLVEIEKMCSEDKSFAWNLIISSEGNRISAQLIKDNLTDSPKKKFLLCGPSSMMYEIADDLQKMGVKNADIIYEDFSFK